MLAFQLGIQMLFIDKNLAVPERELSYRSSRSSGPGGQNVNKVETRVTVLFDLDQSSSLDDGQRALIRERLATRINKEGVLRVVSQKHRTQAANRDAARTKLAELLAGVLKPRRKRKKSKVSKRSKLRRLEDKRRRSEVKRRRGRVDDA